MTKDELKKQAIAIRDEKTENANTAGRVGTALLNIINDAVETQDVSPAESVLNAPIKQIVKDGVKVAPETNSDAVKMKGLDVPMSKMITEINVSELLPTSGIGGTNKFTLAEAIKLIPAAYRTVGVKCTFVNEVGEPATFTFKGGQWADASSWTNSASQASTQEINKHNMRITTIEKELDITPVELGAMSKTDIVLAGGSPYTGRNAYVANKFEIASRYSVARLEIYTQNAAGSLELGTIDKIERKFKTQNKIVNFEGAGIKVFDNLNIVVEKNEYFAVKQIGVNILRFAYTNGCGAIYNDGATENDGLVYLYNITYNLIGQDAFLGGSRVLYDLKLLTNTINTNTKSLTPLYAANTLDWCSLGTSISWYNNNPSGKITAGYQTRVMRAIKFKSLINKAVNGGSIKALASDVNNVITDIADVYTIEHGVNDWGQGTAVGTIDDYINNTGTNTFFGAYRIVIDKIYALNPKAIIILITPRKSYGFGGYLPNNWYEPKNGVYLRDYVDAIKKIAEHMSLHVCDIYAYSGANQANLASLSIDTALHPNDDGYQLMANCLIATMREMLIG